MNERTRKRGVIASRAKLELAMRSAGLRTQASLAKKIADIEGLDGEPKDMVNRAFRGKPVEHHTLARIAAALDVEVYSLYLSSEEVKRNGHITGSGSGSGSGNADVNVNAETSQYTITRSDQFHSPKPQINRKWLYLVSAFSLFGILFFLISNRQEPPPSSVKFSISNKEKPQLVIVAKQDNELKELKKAITEQLQDNFDVSISSILEYYPKLSPWEIPNELSVDYVININTEIKGNLKALFIDLLTEDRRIPLFADAWEIEAVTQYDQQISTSTAQEIKSLFGLKTIPAIAPLTEKEAVLHYMDGINIKLEGIMSLARVNQALNHFQQAINLSPQFIKAQSAKCLSLSDSYYVTRDIDNFKQAIKQCQTFDEQGKNSPSYNAAMGNMYRRIGNLERAIDYLQKTLELSPAHIPAYVDLALSQFTKGAKTKDTKLVKESIKTINKAIALSPSRWVIQHTKSIILYSSGDAAGAIRSQEKAVALANNITTINNLASLHFCNGKMSRARELFEQVLTFKDTPLIAKYNLASVYSFYLDNERAANLMEEYLVDVKKKNGEIHTDALVGLADIYNQMENYEKSRENYELAYKQLEAERLNGQQDAMHEVHRTYIEIALGTLANAKLTNKEIDEFSKKLVALEKMKGNPNVKVMLIFGWFFLNNLEQAEALFVELAPQCQAMADAPVFKRFRL